MGLRILVTGAAGLVGAELCRDLTGRGHAVVGMVRSRTRRAGDFRTADGPLDPPPHPGGPPRPGLAWVAGDVCEPGLCVSGLGGLDVVVHCAALTDFAAAPARHRAVNVEGTRHAAAFAAASGAGLLQVSTAYVCGEHSGSVAEAPPRRDRPVAFSNAYEASKAEAEIVAAASGVPLAVARPSIVVGRAADGAIGRFENIYAFLRLIGSGRLTVLPAAEGASLDLVPVDHVAMGLSDIAENFERARDRVVHLVSGQPMPITELVAIDYPGFRVPRLVAPDSFDPSAYGPEEAFLHAAVTTHFASYLRRDPRFSADALTALSGRTCPPTGPGFLARLVSAAVRVGYLVPDPSLVSGRRGNAAPGPGAGPGPSGGRP